MQSNRQWSSDLATHNWKKNKNKTPSIYRLNSETTVASDYRKIMLRRNIGENG